MKTIKVLIALGFILISSQVSAGKIKRGFEALEIYNYFEAKRLFEKSVKRHEVAACYGLSIIYQRKDNPFTNIDSAYANIVRSFICYPHLKEKNKLKYKELGIDSMAIVKQRNLISSILYYRTRSIHEIDSYQEFITMNPWSKHKDSAIYFRDYLAYELADQAGTSDDYLNYVKTYPGSEFAPEARGKYEETLYIEQTSADNLMSYIDFLNKHPESPFAEKAEDRIFEIYTETGSKTSYENFINEYPQNHNVSKAWRYLFNTHVEEEYSIDRLDSFIDEYPEYPFRDELAEEIALAKAVFYPVKIQDQWGFVDEKGETKVQAVYQGVEWFSEGLAVVRINNKYGYINKRGQLVIAAKFDDALDFNEGHALVEVDEKWGMIKRNGEFVIEPNYEDLGNMEEGLTYFQDDDGIYGYFDAAGRVRLKPIYEMAYDFENGKAVVSSNEYYGLIDEFGTTYIPFKYEDLIRYEGGIYAAKLIDKWGLISLEGDTIAPFEFDYIGKMNSNRAIVEKDEMFNYIDMNGKFVFNNWLETYAEYRQLATFSNGYARVKFEKGYNLIDTTGKKLFAKDREGLGEFGDLIAVEKKDEWGYMDKTGRLVIDYNFSHATSFKGDYAFAGVDPFWGLINKSGDYVIEPKFEELRFLNDSLILGKSMGRYGIMTTEGDTVLQFRYITIEPISDLVVKIEEGGDLYYYDLARNVFIRRED